MGIVIKNLAELEKMRRAGDGTTTAELDRITQRELARRGAKSAYTGYRPGGVPAYPAVLCTSINHVVVHGIPSKRDVLREGDVIGIDFACYKDGFCADAARTVAVGIISAPARDLLAATRECLARALAACGPGNRLGDTGAAIQGHAGAPS